MNHPRSPTKPAILWRVIIARSYRKIYHYFIGVGAPGFSVGDLSESRHLTSTLAFRSPFNNPSVCPQGSPTVRL